MNRKEEIKERPEKYSDTFETVQPTANVAFEDGAIWADKTMIEKGYNRIEDNISNYIDRSDYMAEDFKKAMMED